MMITTLRGYSTMLEEGFLVSFYQLRFLKYLLCSFWMDWGRISTSVSFLLLCVPALEVYSIGHPCHPEVKCHSVIFESRNKFIPITDSLRIQHVSGPTSKYKVYVNPHRQAVLPSIMQRRKLTTLGCMCFHVLVWSV